MALKDLVVYVDQTEDSLECLRLAAELAVRHDSYLTALYAREWSRAQLDRRKAAELGLVSARSLSTLDNDIEAAIAAAADKMRAILDERARANGLRSFSEQLLFVTARPVLFVPGHRAFGSLGRHIAVAWNSSRPAARSLNDALPLIERADKTTVMMINPSDFIAAHQGPSGEQMIDHLRRHGATVEAVRVEDVPHSDIAGRLQREALAQGADLIVAGAFGHPRLWEKMLGGVTHELLANMDLPVFMSH